MRAGYAAILALSISVSAAAQENDDPEPAPTPGEIISSELVAASGDDDAAGENAGPGSLTPDPFTGAAHYQIALPLPPLRGFDMPPPALVYNSRSGNGVAGVGWSFEFGSIAVSRQRGDTTQTDLLHHSAAGTVKLKQTAPGQYGVEVAPPFDDYRQDAAGNWIKTDAAGAQYRFTELAPITAPSGDVGRNWYLVSGADPSGNFFTVSYHLDGGFAYVATAEYGAFAGAEAPPLAPHVEYRFTYEARPDPIEIFRDGRSQRIAERLRSAELYAGGTLQRSYRFEYSHGSTGRSLLEKLVEVGPGGEERTLLAFDYSPTPADFDDPVLVVPANAAQADELKWTGVEGVQAQFVDFTGGNNPRFCAPKDSAITCRALDGTVPASTENQPGGYLMAQWGDLDEAAVRTVDVDTDGMPDVCLLQARLTCWMNSNGQMDHAIGGPEWNITDKVTVGSLRFGDVNGDGFPDVCRLHEPGVECVPGSADGFRLDSASRINGPAWRADQQTVGFYRPWQMQEHYSTVALVDLDRDGADDLCGRTADGMRCFRGGKTGFDLQNPIEGPRWNDPPAVPGPIVPVHGYARTNWLHREHFGTIAYPDINGDTLPDICARDADGIVCYLNQGGKFDLTTEIRGPQWSGPFTTPPPEPGQPPPPQPPFPPPKQWEQEGRWRSIAFHDVNGDGRADVCGRAAAGYDCYLSDGRAFPTRIEGPRLADSYEGGDFLGSQEFFQVVRFTDINGDARPDICARTRKGVRCWKNKAGFGEMLVSIKEHLGATISLAYGPANATPGSRIPFATPVLTEYRRDSGNGSEARARYAYSGGFHHVRSGTFRGFAEVTETTFDQNDRPLRARTTRFAQATATAMGAPDDLFAATSPMKGRVLEKVTGMPVPGGGRFTVAPGDRDVVRNRYRVEQVFGRQFAYADRIESWSCSSGLCDPAPVATEFVYERGYLKTEKSYGLPDTPTDDTTTRYAYRWHPDGPFARITTIERLRGIATVQPVQQTAFLYDETHACDPAAPATRSTGWGRGLVTRITKTAGALRQVTLAGFDPYGNTTCAYSPASGRTETEFDPLTHSFAIASRNAVGLTSRQLFAGVNAPPEPGQFGMLREAVSVNGGTTGYTYDAFGRVTAITDPIRGTRSMEYLDVGQAASQRIRTLSPTGVWSESYFDGDRRVWREVRPDAAGGRLSDEQEFDPFGNVLSARMARLASEPVRVSRFEYDYRGRVIQATSVAGDITRHCYLGHTEVVIGPTGKRTDRLTDQLGRLSAIVQYGGEAAECSPSPGLNPTRTSFEYHPMFGLNRIYDSGRDITVRFDNLGRKDSVIDSRVGNSRYEYDARGLLKAYTGTDGGRIAYTYDAIGRPTQKTETGTVGAVLRTRYFYDGTPEGRGKLTSFESGELSTTFLYRLDGQLASSMRTIGERTYVINRQYDADGILRQLIYPDGYAVRYVNSGGYLREIQDGNGALLTFDGFDGIGRPSEQRFRNGVVSTSTFAGNDDEWCPGTDLYLCGIDLAGADGQQVWRGRQQIDAARRVVRTADSATGENQYQYDEDMRLIGASGGATGFSYGYDDQDNIITNGQRSFQYASGRLRTALGWTYDYDAGGRVRRISRSLNSPVEIGYDPRGRLKSLSGPIDAEFLFDDSDRLARYSVDGARVDVVDDIAECRGEGRCRNMLFINGGLAAVIGDRGDEVFFYHGDLQGSIRAITDSDGAVLRTYAYGPYGERIGEARGDPSGLLLRRAYLGAPQLPETGYQLLGVRLYDPRIARFLQPDEGNPTLAVLRRANPYSYGFDSPLTYSDPNGECPVCVVIAIGAALGATHAALTKRNILEGALMGALAGAGGYYAAGLIGSTFWGTVVSQSVIGGYEAVQHGESFETGVARGAISGVVSAGLGRATMKLIPVPDTETAQGAILRQSARDFVRGSAKSVIIAAIEGESDPFRYALAGGLSNVGYGLAQTYSFAVYASVVADGPVEWQGHSFVVRTDALLEGYPAMRLGMFTLMQQSDPNLGYDYPGLTTSDAEFKALLLEEDVHGQQYNALGHNFLPAYIADAVMSGGNHDDLAMEREAHPPRE